MLQYFGQTKRTKIVTLQQKHHKDIRIYVKHLMQPSFSCGVSLVNAQFQRSAGRLEDNGKDATVCTDAYRGRAVTEIKVEHDSKVTYVIRQSTILQQQLSLAVPDPPVWTSFRQIRLLWQNWAARISTLGSNLIPIACPLRPKRSENPYTKWSRTICLNED